MTERAEIPLGVRLKMLIRFLDKIPTPNDDHSITVEDALVEITRLKLHEKATMNVVQLMATWESMAANYPDQKQYWDKRINELDTALKPLLEVE